MQKARLIISDLENPFVDAEDCDESYFKKGLQCPTCNGQVFWRSPHPRYIQGNEQIVRATFVHSPSAPSNCPERKNSFDNYFEGESNSTNALYQNSEKYENAVLRCLKYHQASKVTYYHQKNLPQVLDEKSLAIQVFVNEKHLEKQISFNKKVDESEKICLNPNLFIESASKVLNSNQAFKYLENKAKEIKNTSNQREKAISITENLVGIIGYLQNGGSDKFRQKFIDKAILGSPRLSIQANRLWSDREIRLLKDWLNLEIVCDEQLIKNHRLPEIEMIKSFNGSLRRIRDKPQFLTDRLNDFEKDPESPNSKFVTFVLERSWEAIKDCDWSIVPELYV
jgi:hypothetical protein